MGGAQFTSGDNISPGTDKRGNVRDDNPFTGGGGGGSSTKGSHQHAGGDGGNGVVLIREIAAAANVKGIWDLKPQYLEYGEERD